MGELLTEAMMYRFELANRRPRAGWAVAGVLMVGLVVCSYSPEHARAWIHRIMIDEKFQNKGYSRATMQKILQRLTRIPGCKFIGADWRPGNSNLEKCYASFQFQKTGQRTAEGDVVAILRLNDPAAQLRESDESA